MNSPQLRVVSKVDSIAEKIATELGGKADGNGWKCRCPVHDDSQASLSLASKEGKLLIHCHAGCAYEDVKKKLVELELLPKNLKREKRIVATYEYKNSDGTTAFEKLRYEPKDFRIRRWDSSASEWVFRGATKAVQPVLYRLPDISAAIGRGDTVVICEGEKDVDAFNALTLDGLVATTNFEGALKWRREYTDQLAGSRVVILEDNDDAGRQRTQILAAALTDVCPELRVVRFTDLPNKSDFSDWLALKPRSREDVIAKLRNNEKIAVNPWLAVEEANYQHYIDFAGTVFPGFRSETLSGKLYCQVRGEWHPLDNHVDTIKSEAAAYPCFEPHLFQIHLRRYNDKDAERRLLVDIPQWDEHDRIKEIADVVRMANCDQDTLYELLKHFGASIFRRLADHEIQNPTVIFTGPQGIGKDSFIKAVFGGLGQYMKDLDLRPMREQEAVRQLHKGLLFNIPEFDRTCRTEIATLKYLLSTATTDTRLPYERDDETRKVRASFISSANIDDVIADWTGGRRYWVFRCDFMGLEVVQHGNSPPVGTGKVLESYPGLFGRENRDEERLQLVAQMKELADSGFRADVTYLRQMESYVASLVPENPDDLICQEYSEAMKSITVAPADRSPLDNAALYSVSQLDGILSELTRKYGRSRPVLLKILGRKHREKRKQGHLYRAHEIYDSTSQAPGTDDIPF